MSSVVVVTGGTAGVGRAVVREFARRGCSIGILARDRDRLAATVREVEQEGARALALPADVAEAEAVDAAAQRVETDLGPIEVWVNNAMTSVFAPVRELTSEEVRRVTAVTYLGSVHGTLAALRVMGPRDRGTIVQVGSALAYRSIPLQAAYCGAKHAVQGFLDSLRCELIHDGSHIRLTSVHLPAMNTPQFEWVRSKMGKRAQPVPPIYQPELAASAIVWAAAHAPRQLSVGGSTTLTLLAQKLAPGLLDHYLARFGYDAQLTDEPETSRLDNLLEPVPGAWAAHGRFDAQATGRSWQLIVRSRFGTAALPAGTPGRSRPGRLPGFVVGVRAWTGLDPAQLQSWSNGST